MEKIINVGFVGLFAAFGVLMGLWGHASKLHTTNQDGLGKRKVACTKYMVQ